MKQKLTIEKFQEIVRKVKNLDVHHCFDEANMQQAYSEFVKLELVNNLLSEYGISFEKYREYIEWRNEIKKCFERKVKKICPS